MEGGTARGDPKTDGNLERVLRAGRFAVTTEVSPPASADPAPVLASARRLRGCADAYNVTDCTRANVRMASWAASALLLREGLEPVMQVATRDRNRIALQADVLGAAAIGVRNVLCLSGDDPATGNEREARAVFDLETEAFVEAVRTLRDRGVLRGGERVEAPPRLFIGATANPFAGPLEDSFGNLRGKAEAGADFVQTQAIYDVERFEEWMHLVRKEWLHEKVHILAGVIPLKSPRLARFLNEKVPGVAVPPATMARIEGAADPKREGVRIAVETIEALRKVDGVRGVHIMAVGWEDIVPALAEDAGLLPRPLP